jgi:hypothetical protein
MHAAFSPPASEPTLLRGGVPESGAEMVTLEGEAEIDPRGRLLVENTTSAGVWLASLSKE